MQSLREGLPGTAIIAGSGVGVENVQEIMRFADAAIVGTSIKFDRVVTRRVDPHRIGELMGKIKQRKS
ncbi:MAG: hypothetical protein D6814_02030 [Calditrichaeota bacterium]|nr:MAG: hypothetical protein D6814_02030 [Calditrichota bacterium]